MTYSDTHDHKIETNSKSGSMPTWNPLIHDLKHVQTYDQMLNIFRQYFGNATQLPGIYLIDFCCFKCYMLDRKPKRRRRKRDKSCHEDTPLMVDRYDDKELGIQLGDYLIKWYFRHYEYFLMTERSHGYATNAVSESHFGVLKYVRVHLSWNKELIGNGY